MRKRITYNELLRTVHDKIPTYISFLLMMKLDFTENIFFYILSYFLRFVGILILCGNFDITQADVYENEAISNYLRYLTANKAIYLLNITNLQYIIISAVVLVLFIFRMLLYLHVIREIKNKNENVSLTKYQVILDHLVFLFYPFIVEFLSQIYFAYAFPGSFTMKLDFNKYLNIVILVFNTFLIIGYNFNNFLYLNVVNRPLSNRHVPVRFRYTKPKFWVLFLLQNTIIIECLDYYLKSDKALKIYCFCYFGFFGILFICLFWTSLSNYNYNSITNKFLTIMANFSFFSIISEALTRLFGYRVKTLMNLAMFNICKAILAIYFEYLSGSLSDSFLFKIGKKEIFKINKLPITDPKVYDVFLYMFELMKDIKHSTNGCGFILLNSIFEHQENCSKLNCKCKLIQIVPYGKEYDMNFINNLLARVSFLVESAFIEIDYTNNYDLTILLSEHFCEFKNNPVIAYSMLQTLLFFHSKDLEMDQLLILYETCQKYIEVSLNKGVSLPDGVSNSSSEKIEILRNLKLLQEKYYRETFMMLEKIVNIQKLMIEYIKTETTVIKYKEELESTLKIIPNEDNSEILRIKIPFLNSRNIEKVINLLRYEDSKNKDIVDGLSNLKSTKLPIDFYYKAFLFSELFREGKIRPKLIPIYYSFTNDRNLYSEIINPSIFTLLRQRFIDANSHKTSKKKCVYYAIFRYSKNMTVSFFTESLSSYLGYTQDEIINNDISVLIPNELYSAHSKLVLRFLITKQNRVFSKVHTFMFDKLRMGVNSFITGSLLPGLGKHLLVIISIRLEEHPNLYHLYFTNDFDLISMSMNFKENYLLDIELVQKYKMNILSLFTLNENDVKNNLIKKRAPEMQNFKDDLDMLTDEYFTNKLFTQNSKYHKKFQLLDKLKKNYSEGNKGKKILEIIKTAKKKMELIHNKKMDDKINFKPLIIKATKKQVCDNFNKFIEENINIDYNDKSYKTIIDSFHKFKQFNHLLDNTNIINENNLFYDSVFEIKVFLRFLYDTPFLMLEIEEILKITEDKISSMFTENITNNNNSICEKTTTRKKGNANTTNSVVTKGNSNTSAVMTKVSYSNKSQKITFLQYIIYNIFILIFSMFTIYIVVVFYQKTLLSNSYNIFLALFYDYNQRDQLLNLYSVLISGYFQYMHLVNYTEYFSIDDYNKVIRNSSRDYREMYHLFYKYYREYNFGLNKDLKTLYTDYNFHKLGLDWEEISYVSNYMDEADNIVHLSKTGVTFEVNKNDIIEDFSLFFNSKFKTVNDTEKIVRSNYMLILYYFAQNYNNVYSVLFKDMQRGIQDDYKKYSRSSEKIYIMLECFGLIINLFLAGLIIFFLVESNKEMFRNILNLFIDNTQPDNTYTFKNHMDNIILIEKLNQFNYLMGNFNLNSLDKYNKIISHNNAVLLDQKKSNIAEGEMKNIEKNEKNERNESSNSIPKSSNRKNANNKKLDINNKNSPNDQTSSISKTSNKLLMGPNTNAILSKLNQKNNPNAVVKNNILSESSGANLKKISKEKSLDDSVNSNILTPKVIVQKTKTVMIKEIKLNIFLVVFILIIIIAYFVIKLLISLQQIKTMSNLFNDFGSVTYQYTLLFYYFSNFALLLINQNIGNETIFNSMTSKLSEESKNSIEVQTQRLSDYPKTFEVISTLNMEDKESDKEKFINIVCEKNEYCEMVLNTDFSLFLEGFDIGIDAIFYQIQNKFKDYMKVKQYITNIENITSYFIDFKFMQIDLNLNFVASLIEEKVNEAFLEDVNNLKADSDQSVAIFNSIVIVFLFIYTMIAIIFIVLKIINLGDLIENSAIRINKAFCLIKLKNMGMSMKTSSIV